MLNGKPLRSPEVPLRVAIWIVFGILAFGPPYDGENSPIELSIYAVGLVVCAFGAWRSSRVRVELTPEGIVDVGFLGTRTIAWTDVRAVFVGKPDGLAGGYCVRIELADGSDAGL